MDTRSLRQIAVESLASTECPNCHGTKNREQPFCSRCYFSLPKSKQFALYKTLSDGYVEAWDEAREWLKGNTNARSGTAGS